MKIRNFLSLIAIVVLPMSSGTAMADVDGAKLFKKMCASCHSMVEGNHKVGPSLYKVMGRTAGSTNFPRYKALRNSDIVWNPQTIDGWITNPKKFIGKSTAMTVKVRKEQDRKAIIQFLMGADE